MLLSIITINRNNLDGLKNTIESVRKQTFRDFEMIVVDGASTDGADAYLQSLTPSNYPFLHWKSEPDTGIYNAMNKGIKRSSGDYLLFLNSGDYLAYPDTLQKFFSHPLSADITQGYVYIDKVGGKTDRGYGKSDITFIDVWKGRFLHQATFFHRTVFTTYGLYDERYKIAGDSEFFIRSLGFGNATFEYKEQPISVFLSGGISDTNVSKAWNLIIADNTLTRKIFSDRLWTLCEKNHLKEELYDSLHSNKIIFGLSVLLSKLARILKR